VSAVSKEGWSALIPPVRRLETLTMPSDDSGLPPERPRPAPTIDLKAKEVSSRPAGGDKPASKKPEPAAPEAPKEKAAEKPAAKDKPPEKPADPPRAAAAPPSAADAPADTRPLHMRPVVWAAAAGATVAVFGLGVWLGTSLMNRDEQLAQVTARLGKIEAVLANAPATDTAIKTTDTAMKATADNVASLGKRVDELAAGMRDMRTRAESAASSADAAQKAADAAQKSAANVPGSAQANIDAEALSNRIAALEQSARSSDREQAAQQAAQVADDKVSRRAVVASALRDSVERGSPFVAELAAAKIFAADANALAQLEPFAATGVPSVTSLARELSTLAQPMMKAIGEPVRTGSVMEKLQAGAEKLVRIRPVGETAGDDPATVVGRIEAKAARNDIAGALVELNKLPPSVRAPAEGWMKRAASRDAAIAAGRQFAADALGALGKPSL
jgi:hypothetical protein